MTVLHPQAKERWGDPNSGSLVLSWEYEEIRGLFMGICRRRKKRNCWRWWNPATF